MTDHGHILCILGLQFQMATLLIKTFNQTYKSHLLHLYSLEMQLQDYFQSTNIIYGKKCWVYYWSDTLSLSYLGMSILLEKLICYYHRHIIIISYYMPGAVTMLCLIVDLIFFFKSSIKKLPFFTLGNIFLVMLNTFQRYNLNFSCQFMVFYGNFCHDAIQVWLRKMIWELEGFQDGMNSFK